MDRLEKEKKFQDKKIYQKYVRFISDVNSVINYFYSSLLKLRNKKILNLGCGTGSMTVQLAKNKNYVSAIDISPESIRILNKEINKEKVSKYAKGLLMNAEKLKFKDNSFDVVYGVAILHHLDLEKVMPELKRVCKGKLYFIEPVSYNPIVKKYRKRTPSMRTKYEHPFTNKDLKIIKKYFKVKIKGFYLLQTIMPEFVKHDVKFKKFRNFLDIVDSIILIILPFLKRYCYSWILELKN